jgi:hypothetical protein
LRDGIVLGVAEADEHLADLVLVREGGTGACENHMGAAAFPAPNINIEPSELRTDSGAECFCHGFFRRKAPGIRGQRVPHRPAVVLLFQGEHSREKFLAVPLDCRRETRDLHDIDPDSENAHAGPAVFKSASISATAASSPVNTARETIE